jgi:hypothetical protein
MNYNILFYGIKLFKKNISHNYVAQSREREEGAISFIAMHVPVLSSYKELLNSIGRNFFSKLSTVETNIDENINNHYVFIDEIMSKHLLLETLQWLDSLDYKVDINEDDEMDEKELEFRENFFKVNQSPPRNFQTQTITPKKSEKEVYTHYTTYSSVSTNTTPQQKIIKPSAHFSQGPKRKLKDDNHGYLEIPVSGYEYDSEPDFDLYRSSSLLYNFRKWRTFAHSQKNADRSQFLGHLSDGLMLTRIPAWRSYLLTVRGIRNLAVFARKRKEARQFLIQFSPSLLKFRYQKKIAFAFWKSWQIHRKAVRKTAFRAWRKRKEHFQPLIQVSTHSF